MAKARQTSSVIKPNKKVIKKTKAKLKGKSKSKKKGKLTEQDKEQNLQQKEVRNLMENMGFSRAPSIDGKEFVYDGRTSELDDIFYYENIVVITEYTVGTAGTHLLKKKIIYDKINENPSEFIKFLLNDKKFKSFTTVYNKSVLSKYTLNQLQIRIVYASKQSLSKEHKGLTKSVYYFDYSIIKYFESISKVIKKSSKHEFFDFLQIEFSNVADNVLLTSKSRVDDFSGHILPEEHSSFAEGYKLVSFYIDAESLIRRAFVLRRDGWRNKNNIGLYQRMFVAKKIKSMRKYLNDKKRVFVNNIIVTLPVDKIKLFDDKERELEIDEKGNFKISGKTQVMPAVIKIENKSNIIGIIDGQHRSYAYHEGDDIYEPEIAKLRVVQNLLVTGILYPKNEVDEKRIKFEAQLFLEINSNQAGASSQLKQEIEFIMNPFSTVAISKHILKQLNESGPLATMFEEYWYEKSKLKTASIISFGLKPLVKFEGNDTLFRIWDNASKANLKNNKANYKLLNEYKDYCTDEVRNIFIGLRMNIDKEDWKMNRKNYKSILSVTTVNGIINCLRILVENNNTGDVDFYKDKFQKIKGFDFKNYKSSQYRKMGQDIYNRCFKY
ncbi:MAG: DGQHR domain-containing protein [Bacteroidota bacterium]|nr:DGQHR domain-containing protein [Bacteroidota bacterium]